jgi:hypothetical protein
MKLLYSEIDLSNTQLQPIDSGLGIYTGIIHKKWVPEHIKPEASEYIKKMNIVKEIPGYTRIGNNRILCD